MAVPIKPNIGTKADYASRPSVPSNQKQNATEFNLIVSAIRANYERLLLYWDTDVSINETLPVGQYVVYDGDVYRITTSYNVGSPITWNAGNAALIISSGADHFKGVYASGAALLSAHPSASPGDYAYVDGGVGTDVQIWMWDDDDSDWIQGGSGGVVPPADATTPGILKLYPSTSLGSNTDGAPTQNAVKVYVDAQIAAIDGPDLFETYKTKTASHAIDATDLTDINAGKILVFVFDSVSGLTFTLPNNTTRALPIGTMAQFIQYNTGQLTIAAEAGATMRSANSANKTYAQYSQGYARKIATNEWIIGGDITV